MRRMTKVLGSLEKTGLDEATSRLVVIDKGISISRFMDTKAQHTNHFSALKPWIQEARSFLLVEILAASLELPQEKTAHSGTSSSTES